MGKRTSYSALTTFRTCPQRWNYQYLQRLERADPEDTKVELQFGNWWHALRAADSIARGRAAGSLRSHPEEIRTVDDGPTIPVDDRDLVGNVLALAGRWWDSLTSDTQDTWLERLGAPLQDRLTYVHEEWLEQWGDELAFEQPLAVEMRWKRELPSLPHGRNPDTMIVGMIDEIYLDTRRNIVVVRDHKTHRTLGTQTHVDEMMDSQLQLYAWGAHERVQEWGVGQIRAVAYDRARMVAPKSPQLTQTGSLSKSVTDYDVRTYREWVGEGRAWGEEGVYYVSGAKKGQPKWGTYEFDPAVAIKLSDPAARSMWFQRSLTPLNNNIVRTHLHAATYSAVDVREAEPRIEATKEASRNFGSACRWCDFAQLCRAQLIGGPDGEYDLESMHLRRKPQRERQDADEVSGTL